jgi:hypothetical protein
MRLQCHYRAVVQSPLEQEEIPRSGYLSMQTGGRSRFINNYFWASADIEVSCYGDKFTRTWYLTN